MGWHAIKINQSIIYFESSSWAILSSLFNNSLFQFLLWWPWLCWPLQCLASKLFYLISSSFLKFFLKFFLTILVISWAPFYLTFCIICYPPPALYPAHFHFCSLITSMIFVLHADLILSLISNMLSIDLCIYFES